MLDERIEKLKDITVSELSDRATLTSIADLALEYVDSMCTGDAKELWLVFEEGLRKNTSRLSGESKEQLDYLYYMIGWGAFPLIPDEAVEKLFSQHLLLALHLPVEINLVQRIVAYFQLVRGNAVLLDKHRNLLLSALKNNRELLGAAQLVFEGEAKPAMPTISSWIRDYELTISTEKRQSPVGLLEYINDSRNVRFLKDEERTDLRFILEIYDVIRFLSIPDRIEETSHSMEREKRSSLQPPQDPAEALSIPAREKILDTQSITVAYKGDPKLAAVIEREVGTLVAQSTVQLRAIFYEAVQNKNVARTIAVFRVLVEKQDLMNFLVTDERLKNFLSATWEKQYGKKMADEFIQNPPQLKFVRLFIRYILEERLGMSASDAARIGLQIGNIFVAQGKKEYNKMAYFDVKTQQFVWFED